MQKVCSRCSAVFECASPVRGCWCECLQLNAETLAHLKEQYANCLCPACLATYAVDDKQQEYHKDH